MAGLELRIVLLLFAGHDGIFTQTCLYYSPCLFCLLAWFIYAPPSRLAGWSGQFREQLDDICIANILDLTMEFYVLDSPKRMEHLGPAQGTCSFRDQLDGTEYFSDQVDGTESFFQEGWMYICLNVGSCNISLSGGLLFLPSLASTKPLFPSRPTIALGQWWASIHLNVTERYFHRSRI
jgi:hypothetical protein